MRRPFEVGEFAFLPHNTNRCLDGVVTEVRTVLASAVQPMFPTRPPKTIQVVTVTMEPEHARFMKWWQGPAEHVCRRRRTAIRLGDAGKGV